MVKKKAHHGAVKKIIVTEEKAGGVDREDPSWRASDLILRDEISAIDLPTEVAQTLIEKGGIRFRVTSWSMFPVIWEGDILKVEPISHQDARTGDIVLYKAAGRAYAHRLIGAYKERDASYVITCDEKRYRHGRFDKPPGGHSIPAERILGRVTEVERGGLRFRPDEMRLNPRGLARGRLRLSAWVLKERIKKVVIKIYMKVQGSRAYRSVFRRLIRDNVAFFIGVPPIKETKDADNFYIYRRFDGSVLPDMDRDIADCHILAKVYGRPAGNIGLSFGAGSRSGKGCTLYNFVVRPYFRGGGIGTGLLEKALYLCAGLHMDEIKASVSDEDGRARGLFLKFGFERSE